MRGITFIQQVTDANIDTRVDVFLIHENALNDMLYNVLGYERLCATQPTKDEATSCHISVLRRK